MKALLTLLLLAAASTCFAQAAYTYVQEAPTKLGDKAVPAYRSFADTTGKPFTRLFAHATATVTGRVGTRWAVLRKGENEYLVRTSDLPAASQQVVATATPLRPIPFDQATGRVLYTEIVPVPGASQAELYARAQLWFADTFKATKDVVQAADKDAGVIQGTAFQEIVFVVLGTRSPQRLWYTVKLTLKEGRYKYDITELQVQDYPSPANPYPGGLVPVEEYITLDQKKGTALSIARSARREVATAGTILTSSIIAGMSKPVTGTDW